ncbi:MAG: phosphonate C-P lyase system protein PhnG [Rhodobacteraceae bacterium]|jgi:alpha-D-ribose 1-methylphosphonate 5-triphosphate synthase subunit PhnG|nr:phosphonate C-P lyase system protein PhnG [Paracoccaceae bacterium]MBL4556520.1 phosphonate C-P lyase system protein PhnG [Paracoccaceae bacterium]
MSNFPSGTVSENADRKARLSLLARAPAGRLSALWADWLDGADLPVHETLRGPEVGTVMVRGRAGAVGAAFNLGEMTVTRCTVRLASGAVGHGHVQGRDTGAARVAALVDALCEDGRADTLEAAILAPLRTEAEARSAARMARAAATKVAFFTLVRGDD